MPPTLEGWAAEKCGSGWEEEEEEEEEEEGLGGPATTGGLLLTAPDSRAGEVEGPERMWLAVVEDVDRVVTGLGSARENSVYSESSCRGAGTVDAEVEGAL